MTGSASSATDDFPALFVAADWIENHCAVPDGEHRGELLGLVDWQLKCVVNHYRIRPEATVGQRAPAFHYRRSQIVMGQKAGKSPTVAAFVCVEGVGPALFAGFADGGETWDCRDHGCGCGWVYEYPPGEPMGRPWPTPLVQITAFSEDQTDNVYDVLRPMIQGGPLAEVIPKTGEEFIRLPGGGRIDVVTSSARSRLGQRVTFAAQGETGIWTPETGMVKVAETQRRGLAGMGGRALEETNAWDPAENSVAQRTAESKSPDIFRHHPRPSSKLSYTNKRDRRKIHELVYKGSWWVDLDAIEAEAKELIEVDPAQAERFFGNRPESGGGMAFNVERWRELYDGKHVVPDDALVVVGVDGARFDDALAMVATEVETGYQWPLGVWEVPENAPDDYEHPFEDVDAVLSAAWDRYSVWRTYIDPQYIERLVERWQGRWGEKQVIEWRTNRDKPMAYAVRKFTESLKAGDLSHDGDSVVARHIANSRKKKVTVADEAGRQMWLIQKERPMSPKKMDAAVASVLSWEARGDAVAAGATGKRKAAYFF